MIVVGVCCFLVWMIVGNGEILDWGLIWKGVMWCIVIGVLGIGIGLIVEKFLDRGK